MSHRLHLRKLSQPSWWIKKLKNNKLINWIYSEKTLILFAAGPMQNTLMDEESQLFNINSISNLDCFTPTETWHDYDTFVSSAKQSIREGLTCYTKVDAQALVFFGWIRHQCEKSMFNYIGQQVAFEGLKIATCFSVYVHPSYRGQGLFSEGLRYMMNSTISNDDADFVVSATEGPNIAAKKGHIKAGFVELATLTTRTFLGNKRFEVNCKPNSLNLSLSPRGGNKWALTLD